jgi:hypothetical protein
MISSQNTKNGSRKSLRLAVSGLQLAVNREEAPKPLRPPSPDLSTHIHYCPLRPLLVNREL